MLIHYFKSAVAFFFLFFLHGFSIGTRQQGISYNVLQLNADFVLHKICDLGAVITSAIY
jgi:hypothetical protein